MTRYKKKMLILAMALIVCAVSILPWTQVAYATPDAEPTKTTIADKLILQLGPDWAGVEFELVTDVGKYPGTIVVDTNNNPTGIDYIIPGNDDSIRAVQLYVQSAATAILSGKANSLTVAPGGEDEFVEMDAVPAVEEPVAAA